jgi:hypothetical protein
MIKVNRVLHGILVTPNTYQFVMDILLPGIESHIDELAGPSECNGPRYDYTLHLYCQGFTQAQQVAITKDVDVITRRSNVHSILNFADFMSIDQLGGNWVRSRVRSLVRGYDYYIVTDDDFEFVKNSFKAYRECLDHLVANSDCASIMCAGALGSGGRQDFEVAPYRGLLWTNRGCVYRNLELVMPDDYNTVVANKLLEMETSIFDDISIQMYPMRHGFYTAKQFKNPTRHYHMPPPATAEMLNSPRIPARVRPYFQYKVGRSAVYDFEAWNGSDECDLFREMTDVAKATTIDYSSVGNLMVCSKSFLATYRAAAIERFGEAKL